MSQNFHETLAGQAFGQKNQLGYQVTWTNLEKLITSPQSNLRRARRKCPIGYIGTP